MLGLLPVLSVLQMSIEEGVVDHNSPLAQQLSRRFCLTKKLLRHCFAERCKTAANL
jgi:hypothetical protein